MNAVVQDDAPLDRRHPWRRSLQFGVAVVACAALALLLHHRSREHQPSGAGQPHDPEPSPLPVKEQVSEPAQVPATAVDGGVAPGDKTHGSHRRLSRVRVAYETEPRDAHAPDVEARIRQIFAKQAGAEGCLREVRCTATVCKIDARWSKALHDGYNAALITVISELSNEVSFEPGGDPDAVSVPMAIFVRRR